MRCWQRKDMQVSTWLLLTPQWFKMHFSRCSTFSELWSDLQEPLKDFTSTYVMIRFVCLERTSWTPRWSPVRVLWSLVSHIQVWTACLQDWIAGLEQLQWHDPLCLRPPSVSRTGLFSSHAPSDPSGPGVSPPHAWKKNCGASASGRHELKCSIWTFWLSIYTTAAGLSLWMSDMSNPQISQLKTVFISSCSKCDSTSQY